MEQSLAVNQLYIQFKDRAERIGARVQLVRNMTEAAQFIATTVSEKFVVGGPDTVAIPSQLADQPDLKAALGERLIVATSTASITAAAAGTSFGEFGIAETGSVAYAVNDLLERELAMLSVVYFALLYTDKLVPSLDRAGELVRQLQMEQGRRYISFVTGPSRTADIERVLTIGVQGPKELYVVLIES